MLKTKALILAKVETTPGTDAAPTTALNSILCSTPEINPVTKKLERKNVKSYLGAPAVINIGEGMTIKFTTEIRGSGTPGTPPPISPLMRACGYTETIVANTSVAYAPNSAILAGESCTIWYWLDGLLHKVVWCIGTFETDLKAGEYGTRSWEFTGIYAGPVDALIQTPAYNATIPPRFISAAFAIDSYAAIIESLKIKAGNEIAKRPSANAATGILSYFIKDRAISGDIDPEVPAAMNAGAIKTLAAAPTAPGTGYTVGDILTITTGGTLGTAKVLTITGGSGTGPVGTVELVTKGKDYTAATGKAVSGGTGSSCTLNITAIETDVKDFWTLWSANTLVALTAKAGAVAGNICTWTAPKVQITDIKYADRENLATLALPLNFTPNNGNDELIETYT